MASILALRMGSAANDILSVTQTAFVPGRDIADNVLFHLEEVDWLDETAPGDGCQVLPGRTNCSLVVLRMLASREGGEDAHRA